MLLTKLKDVMVRAGAQHFLAFPFRIHESRSPKHHPIYLGKHELGLG